MKRSRLLLALLLALALVVPLATTATAQPDDSSEGARHEARGSFAVQEGRAHTEQFGSPSGAPTLFDTDPLAFSFEEGDTFAYSSITCDRPAPFNDDSLIFRPGYPGIESPADARYLLEGTVTDTRSDDRGFIEGTFIIVLCEDGEESDQIVVDYQGRLMRTSDNDAVIRGAQFQVVDGTGRFEDISGRGSLQGRLTCLPPVLERHDADSCEDLGAFSDAAFNLRGNFHDPTTSTGS